MKTITLRITPDIDDIIDLLHVQLCCSRQEAIRRCILYCSTCPNQVIHYLFRQTLLTQGG